MANRFSLYSSSFVHAGGTLDLTQMAGQDFQPAVNRAEITPGGALDRGAVVTASAAPRFRLTTGDIGTVLGTVDLATGLYCSSGATMRAQLRATGGAFAGTLSHVTLTTSLGWLGVESITVDADTPARCELVYIPWWNGSDTQNSKNTVVVINTSQTISTTPAWVGTHFLGPLYINSVQQAGLLSYTIRPGIDFRTVAPDDSVLPTDGSIYARRPTIEMTFLKVDMLGSTADLVGSPLAGTIAAYLLKAVAGAGRADQGSGTNHIKISAASGGIAPDSLSVTGEDDHTVTLTARPTASLASTTASNVP